MRTWISLEWGTGFLHRIGLGIISLVTETWLCIMTHSLPPTMVAPTMMKPTIIRCPPHQQHLTWIAAHPNPKQQHQTVADKGKWNSCFREEKKLAITVDKVRASDASSHFSMEESILFLVTMEEILPFDNLEWQMVVTSIIQTMEWTVQRSIATQAQLTGNIKIPGDPLCPVNVCLAKKVGQLMVQKFNAVDLEDMPASKKAGDNNLLLCGVYSDYDTTLCQLKSLGWRKCSNRPCSTNMIRKKRWTREASTGKVDSTAQRMLSGTSSHDDNVHGYVWRRCF
jgi:hypothetical protein